MPPAPLVLFREYMQLERRRAQGLSPPELERWNELRRRLDGVFAGFEAADRPNRRATPRVPARLDVHFVDDEEIGRMLMTNLSRGGLFVPADRLLPIGREVRLSIRIDDPPRELLLQGEIVSHNLGPKLDLAVRGMGIRFKNLNDRDQQIVDELYDGAVENHLADS